MGGGEGYMFVKIPKTEKSKQKKRKLKKSPVNLQLMYRLLHDLSHVSATLKNACVCKGGAPVARGSPQTFPRPLHLSAPEKGGQSRLEGQILEISEP